VETGHELFVHGLNDMLDAEEQLVAALEELAKDSSRQLWMVLENQLYVRRRGGTA
jgi:ferritin-like metal-binding protein YciE